MISREESCNKFTANTTLYYSVLFCIILYQTESFISLLGNLNVFIVLTIGYNLIPLKACSCCCLVILTMLLLFLKYLKVFYDVSNNVVKTIKRCSTMFFI